MVNRNLIRSLENDEAFAEELAFAMPEGEENSVATIEMEAPVGVNNIVEGRVIRIDEDRVLVDVGFKSE